LLFGSQSCSWGLQFSYPHLFQNENYKVFQVNKEVKFVNNHLFKQLKSWLRANSMPTTFITSSGKVFCSPIKIGKSCCGWINMHPQLQQLGLKVKI